MRVCDRCKNPARKAVEYHLVLVHAQPDTPRARPKAVETPLPVDLCDDCTAVFWGNAATLTEANLAGHDVAAATTTAKKTTAEG